MTKAMVIGAGGWLGSRLVQRLLADGRAVIGIDVRFGPELQGMSGLELIEADLGSLPAYESRLQECGTVFNCAGLLHPKKTAQIYRVNRDAAVALYEACCAHGVGCMVHISSINATGQNASSIEFSTEASEPRPTTHYGHSKLQADRKLAALSATGSTRVVLLRPGVFYGENPSRNLREFMDKVRTGRMPLFGRAGFLRTYVDVDKVVEAMLMAELRGRSGEVYLIGDAEPLSTQRFYQVVADELGVPLRTVQAPAALAHLCEWIAYRAGRADVHLRLPTIVGEFGRHIFCDVGKAQRELRFVPHASSEEGLRRMVRSVK